MPDTPIDKVLSSGRLRVGFKAPIFPNACITVIHVQREMANRIIEATSVLRVLLMGYAPDIANRLIAEDSEKH